MQMGNHSRNPLKTLDLSVFKKNQSRNYAENRPPSAK
jgi:hypothetical protein